MSTFLLSVIIVRTLDLREAAVFFAILASVSFGPLVGRLGLGHNVIRLMGAESDPQKRRRIAGTHLHATAVLSVVTAPVIALLGCNALIGQSDFAPVFVLTSLLIAVESTRLMVSDIFAAAGRVHASVATMHYVRSLLALPLVALVVFATSRPSLVAVLGAYLVVSATQFIVALIHARHEVAIFEFSAGIVTLRTAVVQGTQLFSLDFSEFMLRQGTIWLATVAFSPLAATQYSVAATLALQVVLLDSLCALAVEPPAARLWAAGHKARVRPNALQRSNSQYRRSGDCGPAACSSGTVRVGGGLRIRHAAGQHNAAHPRGERRVSGMLRRQHHPAHYQRAHHGGSAHRTGCTGCGAAIRSRSGVAGRTHRAGCPSHPSALSRSHSLSGRRPAGSRQRLHTRTTTLYVLPAS